MNHTMCAGLLLPSLLLAACGAAAPTTPPTATPPSLQAQLFGIDPACITAIGAEWSPAGISVTRLNPPTYTNANIAITSNAGNRASITVRVVPPPGVLVSKTSFTYTPPTAGSPTTTTVTQSLNVKVSAASAPGTYYLPLYWKASSQAASCQETVRYLQITAY